MDMHGELKLLEDLACEPYLSLQPRCLEEAIFYDLVTD